MAKPKTPARPAVRLSGATLGARVIEAYEGAGFNRHSLSKALGVAYTTIYAWERNESPPSLENLRRLSVLTGVPASTLLDEEGAVTRPQYEAWGRFLRSELGRGMSDDERNTLGSIHFTDGEPSQERFVSLLMALRSTKST